MAHTPWPHGLQHARLLWPWDSPGKNTGMGCHFPSPGDLLDPGTKPMSLTWQADSLPLSHQGSPLRFMSAKLLQLWPTLFDPMDWNPPGSSVHGIFQASILEWVAMPSSRGPSWPRGLTPFLHWQLGSLPLAPPGIAELCSGGSWLHGSGTESRKRQGLLSHGRKALGMLQMWVERGLDTELVVDCASLATSVLPPAVLFSETT